MQTNLVDQWLPVSGLGAVEFTEGGTTKRTGTFGK